MLHHLAQLVTFLVSDGQTRGGVDAMLCTAPSGVPSSVRESSTTGGGSAGGDGGLQKLQSAQSQRGQWSAACLTLHHGAHDEPLQTGTISLGSTRSRVARGATILWYVHGAM